MKPPNTHRHNCAVRTLTGDGDPVGRCWYYAPGDKCPRHGDVGKVMKRYRKTGQLTDEPVHSAPTKGGK